MRRLIPVAAVLVLTGLACKLPVIGEVEEKFNQVQNTVNAALTDYPATAKALLTLYPGTAAAVMTGLPGTIEAQLKTPPAPQNGSIRGHLSYPSEFLPPQKIVAFDTLTMAVAGVVTTMEGQGEYQLSVPAGQYYVVAYTLDGGLAAGYTQAVPCGLTAACTDHSLIPVPVNSGASVNGIDPQDWYAPPGTFPPMP
jgi:hypothetical protein